jgi:hypothetical protein
MGAIVLIGLCVRHMTAFKNLSNARRVARVDYRQRVSAWPTKNSTPSAHRATFESFEGASELSIESATGSILQYRVRWIRLRLWCRVWVNKEQPARGVLFAFNQLLLTTPERYNSTTKREDVVPSVAKSRQASTFDANNHIRQSEAMMALDVSAAFGGSLEGAAAARASAIPRADTTARPKTMRAPRSRARPSRRLGNSQSCPARHSTDEQRRPNGAPVFGKLVLSMINTPRRSGSTSNRRRQIRSASHGACVMTCWNAWYDTGWGMSL